MRWAWIGLLLTGCTYGINTMGYVDQGVDFDTAWKQTSVYEYIYDPPGGYWKSPKEFEADGGGDCEDFTAYMMYLVGDTTAMVILKNTVDGSFHAAIEYNGEILEPQRYGMKIDMKLYKFHSRRSYQDIMVSVTRFGTKGDL